MTRAHFVVLVLLLPVALGGWSEVQSHEFSTSTSNYGYSVSVSGEHAVVGAWSYDDGDHVSSDYGLVEFWRRVGGVWTSQGTELSPNKAIGGDFGNAVSMYAYSPNLAYCVVAGSGEESRRGRVYVYKFEGSSWTMSKTIVASDRVELATPQYFGSALALDANRLVVGATGSSSAYFYSRDENDDWTEDFIARESVGDSMGNDVGLSGDFAVVGVPMYDGTASNSGRVYVYRYVTGEWGLFQTLQHTSTSADLKFGSGVGISGNTLAIGAPGVSAGGKGGEVLFYDRTTGGFSLRNTVWKPATETSSFGDQARISLSDDGIAVIGDPNCDVAQTQGGRVVVYERQPDLTWVEQHNLTSSDIDSTSNEGFSVAYDSGIIVAGGHGHDGASNNGGAAWFWEDSDLVGPDSSEPAAVNPLRCGEYDGANQRYFYDDGTGCETTPTVNDACYYGVSELVTTDAATLRDDLSELKADEGTDYIYLSFDLADKYYNTELVFADAGQGQCAHDAWEQVSATRNVTELDACFTTFVYRLPWTDAYNATSPKCGWLRDTSGTNVKLTLDFAVRAVEDLSAMRNGTTITRTSEFSMPVQVEFPVQVLADATNIQVFSEVRAIAAIIGQAVTIDESTNPDTATLTLRLSTEVQKPFELHAITSESHPGDVTLASTLDGNNDAAIRKDAECTNSALDCGNEWEWTYTTQTTTEPCDFDGAYSVSFTVRCSDENDTDCPIDSSTDSVTISFNVDSNDHCPQVIDSIVLSSKLYVFDAPQRVTAADDFVGDGLEDDGQTAINEGDADQWQVAYFTAPTTSSQVALDTTEFNQVWIERSDADDIILLDKENSQGLGAVACTATAYADADDTASCGTEAGLDSTTCQLIVPDVAFPDKCGAFDFAHRPGTSADAGDDSIPWFEFDINTGASGFNMANDAIETMTVHAVIDVTYNNAAKRTAGSVQETRADFATVAAPLTAGTATGTSTSSTATSSSALFGMNATVLYGAGALLAVAVLAVLVVVSRRRSSSSITKLQSSTELTGGTSV